jgi:hypothetical protein
VHYRNQTDDIRKQWASSVHTSLFFFFFSLGGGAITRAPMKTDMDIIDKSIRWMMYGVSYMHVCMMCVGKVVCT